MEFYPWVQEHLLAIVALVLTLVLIYHYLTERGHGVQLSKKYRSSIFEAQSKIFLNATQYLISGNKDLAIREFLNAVDLNRETIETYFALGGLFRSNGEIEKAISIHRSLIARENISESTRLAALKELAIDFDKGGFVDKAIETYRDVLKINRDQDEVIKSLCRIYEDIEDWDQAYQYRIMLSKVGKENQSETISHILVQKAKQHFEQGNLRMSTEDLDDAFRFAPSVSAKILRVRHFLLVGNMEEAKNSFFELLREHPIYASFIFESLAGQFKSPPQEIEQYHQRIQLLHDAFLDLEEPELLKSPGVILTQIRLLKSRGQIEKAFNSLKKWIQQNPRPAEAVKAEYVRILVEVGQKDEACKEMVGLLESMQSTLTRYYCRQCGYNSDQIFWRCPQCREWETIQFRWKI